MTPDQTPDPRGHFGSGVIVDPKGVIVTNRHVIAGAGAVEVTLQDGRKFTSKSLVQDPKTDLAVIKLDGASGLPFVELGDSDAMEIGDRVLAIGAPFGLAGSVSAGIVSGKGRNLYMNMYEDFLQTDAAINPGNSGGPLVNLAGQVIGINTAIKTQNGGFQGIGLAIPSEIVKEVVWQMARDGVVKRGYLGAEIAELQPGVAAKLHLEGRHAIEVGRVMPNSPGAKSGLKEGDIILSVAGKPVGDVKSLQRTIRTAPLNKPIAFGIFRDGTQETVNVTVEQQPEDYGLARFSTEPQQRSSRNRTAPESVSVDKLGIQVTDLTPELASQLGYADIKGAVITEVNEDSAAAITGLRRGMLIVQAERKPVDSAAALKEALSKASLSDGVLLMVRTPQGSMRRIVIQQSGD
jgi:serine protease Do